MTIEDRLERLWKKIKNISAAQRLIEEKLYEQVTTELSNGQRREGLWAKAFANSDGCEDRAKSLYIKYRVQSIRDEAELAQAAAKEMANERKREEDLKRAIQKNADDVRENTRLDVIEALLSASGYKLKSNRRKGWLVIEPLGGRRSFDTVDELEQYAKSRQDVTPEWPTWR